jgi:peptide/nickel transport system permease protein
MLVLWGALTVVFVLMHLSGDPVTLMLPDLATSEQIQSVRRELGMDRPGYEQYARFVSRAVIGDFGFSYRQNRPVMDIVLERLPATLQLSLLAVVLSTVVGVAIGTLGAVLRDTILDRLLMAATLLGQSVPTFWLGILLILLFAVELRVLPASGIGTPQHLILPAITLGAFSLARTARIARSSMIEALVQDYVRTARAKGLGELAVIGRHALKNASISVVTVTAFTFSTLIGGAIVTEAIFGWPGVGRLIIDSVLQRDYPVVQGAVFVTAVFVAVASLLVDLAYTYLDPRITTR